MKKGYTLIEIILVLAILSIITSLSLPNLKIINKIRIRNDINEFRKDILYARNKAILESDYCNIYLNFDSNKYTIRNNESSPIIKSKEFNYGLKLEERSNLTKLQFNPNGTTGSSGTLYLRDGLGKIHKITIRPVGGSPWLEYLCE